MSFTWDAINCETLGLTVEEYPNRPIPKRKVATYNIIGRSGDLIVDYDAYENVVQEYKVYAKEGGGNSLQENLQAIAAWLAGTAGYKRLTDTYDSAIYRDARVMNVSEFINALNKFGRATLQFDCKPQRWKISEALLTGVIGSTFTIPTEATQPGKPIMTIETISAATSFTITDANGLMIVIPTRGVAINKIEIDWENQTVLNKYNNSQPSGTSISGEWGALGSGETIVTTLDSGIAPTVKIQPRRYYL